MTQYAYNTYTGNGSTTGYAITWNYLDTTHIKCYLDGTATTDFTVSSSTVTFNSAPANGVTIRIERETPLTSRLVDFQDGSVLTESDLDKSANQNFYVAQEITDDQVNNLQLGTDDKYDANSKVIKNVANPVNNNDAVNKTYLENTWLSTSDKSNLTSVGAVTSQIALLGTSDAIADMNTLGTADVVSDMNTLANSDIISDLNTLATSDIVSDMNTLATSSNVTNMNTLAGLNTELTNLGAVSTQIGLLGTSDAIADMNTLGTSDVVNDMNVLGTSANVTAMNTLGTSANVTNMNTLAGLSTELTNLGAVSSAIGLLGTSDAISDMNTLATSDVVNDMNVLGTSANVTAMNNLGTSANVTAMSNLDTNLAVLQNVNTNMSAITSVNSNISDVSSFANRYRIGSSDPSSSLDEGDLFYNSSDNSLKYYNGSSWNNVQAVDLSNYATTGQSLALAIAL